MRRSLWPALLAVFVSPALWAANGGFGPHYPAVGYPGYGAGAPGYFGPGTGSGSGYGPGEPGYSRGYGYPGATYEWGSPSYYGGGQPGTGWARPDFRGPPAHGDRGTRQGYGRPAEGRGRGPSMEGPNPRQPY